MQSSGASSSQFGGLAGSAEAMLAAFGGILPTPGGMMSISGGLPPVLPAAPIAPTQTLPFAASRGGAEGPVDLTQAPTSVGGVLDQNRHVGGIEEFISAVGADMVTSIFAFCHISAGDLEAALEAIDVDGKGLAPLQRGQLVHTIRQVFVSCGFDPPALGCQERTAAPKPLPPAAVPGNSEPKAEAIPDQVVSLAETIDQAAKGTAKLLTYAELAACRATYVAAAGDHPAEEHTPSAEQLSALRGLLVSGRVPYADFAVWGPYGARLARFRKTEAAVFVGNELVHRRADGPTNFDSWLSSWELYSVAMISLGAASLGTMNRFKAGMVQLHKLFPRMWPVLQTTDVILRSERWGRIREQLEANIAMGAPLLNFSSARPWDAVISQSSYGREGLNATWWQSHFVLPCTLSSTAAGATSTIRDLEGHPQGGHAAEQQHQQPAQRPKQNPRQALRPPAPPAAPAAPGTEVCKNYNTRSGRCAVDGVGCWAGRLHKCDVCGGNHRGIDHHTAPGDKYQQSAAKRQNGGQKGGKDKKQRR